ncbi:clustered mitochondria-domain-containing protein [Catenaria anguillulae PL171]|uniref:Clustered mitochondria-domain-containing protein n=1 Tax=Catenaria anguillulae PL171 TaxID=765915 RepID=A0A1Y2HH67_9FUNG|nr:clustered mitochondria-domain-containing protein [Catenaria anguillulae PL171]
MVQVRLPGARTVDFPFYSSDNIATVLVTLLEQPRFAHYTCSHLVHNGSRASETATLASLMSADADASSITLDLVEQAYGERELRFHILRLRDILSSANPLRASSAVSPSGAVDAGMSLFKHVTGEKYLDADFDKDLHKQADQAAKKNQSDELGDVLVRHLVKARKVSPQNKALLSLAIRGDLLYLTAVLAPSGESSTDVQFDPARKTNVYHSLAKLLSTVSPAFAKAFGKLLDAQQQSYVSQLAQIERQPFLTYIPAANWMVPMETQGANNAPHALGTGSSDHTFDALRQLGGLAGSGDSVLEASALDQTRNWNDELQLLMNQAVPGTVASTDGGEEEEAAAGDIFNDGLNPMLRIPAVHGARGIFDGSPGSPGSPYEGAPASDSIYIWNGIFFSFAEANDPRFARDGHADPAAASHVFAGKDVLGIRQVQLAGVKGVCTMPTAVIDLYGRRVIAQAMPPGIMDNPEGPRIIYGNVEDPESIAAAGADPKAVANEKRLIKSDQEFHEVVGKLAEKLHLQEHEVVDEKTGDKHKLWTSADTRGLAALDGRKYLIELARITPVDTKFLALAKEDGLPEYPHAVTLVRPEFVKAYIGRVQDKHLNDFHQAEFDRLVAEGVDPKTVQMDLEKASKGLPKIKCNVDVGTPWEVKEDGAEEANDQQAQMIESIYKDHIPKFVHMWINGYESLPLTGDSLTSSMHSFGLSMRHLGAVVNVVDEFLANPEKAAPSIAEVEEQVGQVHAEAAAAAKEAKEAEGEEGKSEGDDASAEAEKVAAAAKIKAAATKRLVAAAHATHRVRLESLRKVLLREMIARSIKHIARRSFADTQPDALTPLAAALLNSLLAISTIPEATGSSVLSTNVADLTPEQLAQAIVYETQLRFRFTLAAGTEMASIVSKASLLREAAIKMQVQLAARAYGPDFVIAEHDIVNIVPKIKSAHLETPLIEDHMLTADRFLQETQSFGAGLQVLETAHLLAEQAYTNMHPETLRVQAVLANVFRRFANEAAQVANTIVEAGHATESGEIDEAAYTNARAEEQAALTRALELARVVVVGRERVLGVDAAETYSSYVELASLEAMAGRFRLSLKYLKHATSLWLSSQGEMHANPDWVSLTTLIGRYHARLSRFDVATKMFEELAKYYEQTFGPEAPTTLVAASAAAANNNAANSESGVSNVSPIDEATVAMVRKAIEYQQRVVDTYKAVATEDDSRVTDAGNWLMHFKAHLAELEMIREQHKLAVQQGVFKKLREEEERKQIATKGDLPIDDILAYINGERKTLKPSSSAGSSKGKKKAGNKQSPRKQ